MKSRFTGLASVFKFAYIQSVKTKAFLISMVVLMSIAFVALPLTTALTTSSDEDNVDETKSELIGTVYIEDNVFDGKLGQSIKDILVADGAYSLKEYALVTETEHDAIFETVSKSEEGDVLLVINFVEDQEDMSYGFDYVVYYGENVEDLSDAAGNFSSYVDGKHMEALSNIMIESEEGAKLMSYNYISEVVEVDVQGQVIEDKTGLGMTEYWVTYAFIMVGIFSISILGSKVAEQIVTEKSSKVIEYIMTSIRPMALITGKVLASIATVFTMLGGMLVAFVGSIIINGILFKNPDGSMVIPDVVQSLINGDILEGLNIANIIVAVIIFMLSFVLYGFIAGIAGATVSKVEEMAEGVKLFTFAMIIGAYVTLAYVLSATMGFGDWGAASYVVYFVPLSTVFIVPAYLLLGKISLIIGLISIAILVVCIVALMIFVSGIYEHLIYYSGAPLKFKDLLKLGTKKGGTK